MPGFVQFEATTPVVVPATQEIVYDKYWMTSMSVNARLPTEPVRVVVTFVPARDLTAQVPILDGDKKPVLDAEGNPTFNTVSYKELQPGGREKRMVIQDVFARAAVDMEMAVVMNNLFTLLRNVATEQGVL